MSIATRFAADFGLPTTRVLGTGTMLDTARFRSLLGATLGIDPQHVHGYVIGEHGDSEVLTWSLATVGAMSLEDFCKQRSIIYDEDLRRRVDDGVRNAAYSIIEGKGATYYGIGSAIAKIVDVILDISVGFRHYGCRIRKCVNPSQRGGDLEIILGQDMAVGYESHTSDKVKLYYTESFTSRILEPAAVIHYNAA